MVPLRKKKVMYLMLFLFLLYIVFHAIIKATTVHQNLQIIGERHHQVYAFIVCDEM